MSDVRILSMDEPMEQEQCENLMQELRGAFDRAGLESDEIVFINGSIKAIDKADLIEELE